MVLQMIYNVQESLGTRLAPACIVLLWHQNYYGTGIITASEM